MTTITPGADSIAVVTVKRNGAAIALTAPVSATLKTGDGSAVLIPTKTLTGTESGANWSAGVVAVPFMGAETPGLTPGNALLVVSGSFGSKAFAVSIEATGQVARSSLFVRDVAVDKLRDDRLLLAAAGALPSVQVSDDFLWDKLRAAEAAIAHELRVPLVPTAFFPAEPTADEIAALGGMPWAIDPGYDYKPEDFAWNDKWGMLKLRNKPLQSVSRVRFAYPGGPTAHYDLPLDWVRADNKYGTIQFVPSSTAFAAPLNQFVMQAIGRGRSIPLAIQLTYVAGLKDVKADYPDLIDAVYKMAALKIVEDAFLPQSGSISADGLSQSVSNDMANHSETIDRILHGGKGSNGGLMAAIHGIRIGVM